MATEIYICKDGQALKEGKLEYSSDVTDREGADADAKRRCQRDSTIKKIAYYAVDGSGDFKCFHSYTNPNCKPAPPKRAGGGGAPGKSKPSTRKPAAKPGLLQRIKKGLGLG